MKIVLKQMTLTNFKKVRSATYKFSETVTDIFGANGGGKTTIKDAFLWCLFGKDSTNRKDFEIKTLDENNQPFHNLDHEVELTLIVNGDELSVKRSMREKWVKRRGDVNTEFKGHETIFTWNGAPCQLNEYQANVDKLIKEHLFKLVTSTSYFNALDWKIRRNTLLAIAGDITNDQILDKIITVSNKVQFAGLINALNQKKTPEQFKLEIAAKKKVIKDELVLMPSRIDEANRAMGDVVDYSSIELAKNAAEKDLNTIEAELLDITRKVQQQQNQKADKIKEQGNFKQLLQQLEFDIKNKVRDQQQLRQDNISSLIRSVESKKRNANELVIEKNAELSKINSLTVQQTNLRQKWQDVNKEELLFNEKDFCCPTCKRTMEGVDLDAKKAEFVKNFNSSKSEKLSAIHQDGVNAGNQITVHQANVSNIENKITNLNAEIETEDQNIITLQQDHKNKVSNELDEVANLIAADASAIELQNKITALQAEIDDDISPISNADLLAKKETLRNEIDSYTKQLAGKDQRDAIIARINELKLQESEMSQQIADLEGIEFSIEDFNKEKMDELDRRINGRFEIVKFKLFDTQINGGQVECCETLINGVPFSDANTASKVNAGIDIINTLCQHYDVSAPIFIDNRESVTDIIQTDSQIVNLHVSPADIKLRVLAKEMAEAI